MTSSSESMSLDGQTSRYGWILIIGSVLATGFAFVHPQVTGHELGEVFAEMTAAARFNGWVHGTLTALYLCLIGGFVGFTLKLGASRPANVIALIFYAAGAWSLISAAVINGFALAMFAGQHPDVSPQAVLPFSSAFNMAGSIAAVWSGIGVAATSAAILLWSTSLLPMKGILRVIAAFGLLVGVATILMLITGTLILNVHGFLLVVVSQAVWTIAVGAALIQGRINAQPA